MSAPAGTPARVLAVVVPVCVGGAAAVVAAAHAYAGGVYTPADAAAVASLFVCMTLAERFPVPVEGLDSGGVTLGFTFVAAAILLLGWEAGVMVAAAAPALANVGRRPPIRIAYNSAMFALSALAGGIVVEHIHGESVGAMLARLVVCAFLYNWVVNLVLVSAVLSADSGRHFFRVARENVTHTTVPLALMTSAALILVVLWERSPALSVALVGPLLAIALYQRSTSRELRAMRLAFTDPLTGLGNHRSFYERLQRELAAAEREGRALSLCLVDVDDFKTINDRFGHPLGDEVLRRVAAYLRQGGESFRLGGDEFAVLLPRHDEREAAAVADSIVARVGAAAVAGVGPITVSAGVATCSLQGGGRDELIRLADSALYWAKDDGKNRVRAYRDDSLLVAEGAQSVNGSDRESGSHAERVADLAARIAGRLGAEAPQLELIRHAARLHDVGHASLAEIILVADEYDLIATERHGGERSSPRGALAELERTSGARLEPAALEALAAELGLGPRPRSCASRATSPHPAKGAARPPRSRNGS